MTEKELLQEIEQAAKTGATKLDLAGKRIKKLPPQIGQLTNLTELDLSGNQLTELPPQIGQLTNLTRLDLKFNQLTKLPPQIGQLTQLKTLLVYNNQIKKLPDSIKSFENLMDFKFGINKLTTIPDWISNFKNLHELDIEECQLGIIPGWIFNLINLQKLWISKNQLTSLPPELGNLTKLEYLYVQDNQLTSLPPELGKLTKLEDLVVSDNPLTSPPPEIVKEGKDAILTYLREQFEKAERQWISKMLIVGQGGVGKTSLLRALRGKQFIEGLETTHGIFIEPVKLPHPTEKIEDKSQKTEEPVVMQLNTWDFGGQEIYHATHQFFLTNRSLFVLCWNARHGYEQGKLYYWLDTIQARAPQSPALIVATHIDQRDADLPKDNILNKYPQVKGFYEISNKSNKGLEDLGDVIARIAADLPLMGEIWPADWLQAAEILRGMDQKHISPQQMQQIMTKNGVSQDSVNVLAQWLHELGDILYFMDDEELDDTVILKPQWVTEYISMVLECEEVIEKDGIFTKDQMDKMWTDLRPSMRDHFLRLMEKFDLSYRTLENREISLVVERLPLDPPDYAALWDSLGSYKQIAIRFKLNTVPAGIPTWLIARSHRFTTRTHWRNGAVFAYSADRKHLALAVADQHQRWVELTVRGPNPQNFFALLKDGIEVTLARFPGLRIDRIMPCPGHEGAACTHEFKYDQLQKRIERVPPRMSIECPEALEDVDVGALMFGIHWRMHEAVLNRIDMLENRVIGHQEDMLEELKDEISDLRELTQREFLNQFRREQQSVDSHCPNVFVLRKSKTAKWKKALIGGAEVELHLCCQRPNAWHLTEDGGRYIIDRPAKWIRRVAPYMQKLMTVLKFAAPFVAPLAAANLSPYRDLLKNDIAMMKELVGLLGAYPDFETESADLVDEIGHRQDPERIRGAPLRALRHLLDKKDPSRQWGHLKKVLTPEGHYLWLCSHHAKEYD